MRSFSMSRSLMLALLAGALAATIPVPRARATDDVRTLIKTLHWATGTQHLTESDATFVAPPGARMVTGLDAQRIDKAINGTDQSDSEGYVHLESGDTLYLEYHGDGYVTDDDFAKIDADGMISQIRQSTEDGNADKKAAGISPLHVDGWVEKPTFDKATESARFVIGAHDDAGERTVNAVALELGRKGYERLTLVADAGNTDRTTAELDRLTRNYHFATGSRFQDFVSGDKLAGVGIAALVATAAGVTLAKTGAFAVLIALLLKFKIVVLAAVAGLFGRFRGIFKRKPRQVAAAMPQSSPFENPQPPLNP